MPEVRRGTIGRRKLLGWGSAVFAGGAAALAGLRRRKPEDPTAAALVRDPRGLIDLPEGFTYRVLQQAGQRMSDGNPARALPDGMAAFAGEPGQVILMRNHEISAPEGGVSRLVIDLETLEVLSSNDVLRGTSRNCAGGPSPWGWLTCEEDEGGGVWICPTDAARAIPQEERIRIDDYGSYRHEAVAIDPQTLIAYLTEDDGESHLYRMVPRDAAVDPHRGTLQAMRARGLASFETRTLRPGERVEVEWVEVEPARARATAKAAGAAIVFRGEGAWWSEGSVYFTATTNNQVFRLEPTADGGLLTLLTQDFDQPDNLTVAPWGDLFVAEDQFGDCRIRIVNSDGSVRTLARNALTSAQEFAGVCFSPDGSTLFVNMQHSGHTLAIRGPFLEFARS